MPTYDFVCQDCKTPFEVRMSITAYSDGSRPRCEKCGSDKVERTFTAVNVLTSERWTPLAFGTAQHTIMVQVEKE